MTKYALFGLILLIALLVLIAGCMDSPIKEPSVSVGDISLSDVSLRAMTVNTTVVINNPNPIGARLNKVAFDVYYLDDGQHYLGHGEKSDINVKENGNTTVIIPVTIGNIPALQATGSLVQKGSLIVRVNGSAFIDVKVTSFEKPFEQSRKFQASEFEGILPLNSLSGTSINITAGLEQLGGFLDQAQR
jgi:LEA14-like dessication related protein